MQNQTGTAQNHYFVGYMLLLGGKPISVGTKHVSCATGDRTSILAALVAAGVAYPGATLEIVSIANNSD